MAVTGKVVWLQMDCLTEIKLLPMCKHLSQMIKGIVFLALPSSYFDINLFFNFLFKHRKMINIYCVAFIVCPGIQRLSRSLEILDCFTINSLKPIQDIEFDPQKTKVTVDFEKGK